MNRILFPPHELPSPPLQAHQIVYHQQAQGRCYGEVIQVIVERDRCWIRPLAYVAMVDTWSGTTLSADTVQDLRCGPDLICPLGLFHPALDQDWLAIAPLLPPTDLWPTQDYSKCDRGAAQARLRGLFSKITDGTFP